MGCFYCERCDRYGDSHDGDSCPDPKDDTKHIHEDCLNDDELEEIELAEVAEAYERQEAIKEDILLGRQEERKLEKRHE